MIESIEKEITETVKETISKICDVCKEEYSKGDHILEYQEFTHIYFTGGYGSVFGDEQSVGLDICQHCLKKALGKYFREVD